MRRLKSGTRGRPLRCAGGSGGFTLIEVMLAVAIVGVVAVMLLSRRVDAVRDAAETRDRRIGWMLAAWKLAEIERDEKLFQGRDSTDTGTFEEYSPEYREFFWEYEIEREEVPTADPENPQEKPKEIFRVRLKVRRGEEPPLMELETKCPVLSVSAAPPGTAAPGAVK